MALKLGKTALVEIVGILQKGLAQGIDISQALRDMEMEEVDGALELTSDYVARREGVDESWDG